MLGSYSVLFKAKDQMINTTIPNWNQNETYLWYRTLRVWEHTVWAVFVDDIFLYLKVYANPDLYRTLSVIIGRRFILV